MKFMFASDIHGSAYYCRKLLEAMERSSQRSCCFWEIFCIMVRETICRKSMRRKR